MIFKSFDGYMVFETKYIKEYEGKIPREEEQRWLNQGYNVVYNIKENKTYIWKKIEMKKIGSNEPL